MHRHLVNVAIQVLPKISPDEMYSVVDKAIEVIQSSGLKYKVCPFETVIEGPYDKIMNVVSQIQDICFNEGVDELLINLKVQIAKDKDILISDKMEQYD